MNGKDKNVKTLGSATLKKDNNRKVLNFENKQSSAIPPVDEIGYIYTVSFKINPSKNNAANSVIFKSNHAVVKLKQGSTSNLGFSHEGKDCDFGIAVPESEWSHIVITGDNNSTTLYFDGKLAKKLSSERIATGVKKDSIWVMKTLFFSLKTIVDGNNSFVGALKDLKIFNVILTEKQI